MRGTSITDADLELLITGGDPADTTFRDLAPLVAQLRGAGSSSPEAGTVALFAAEASALAIANRPSPPVPGKTRRRGRMVPRLQPIGAMAALLLVIGLGGTAYAADGAIPGGALYGLDRALETVGLGAGGADERIGEAIALFESGDTEGALVHAVEAIAAVEGEELGVGPDTEAVVLAAANALAPDTEHTARPDVMELLVYLSANLHRGIGDDGMEFGQTVAHLARGIGSNPNEDPGDVAPGNQGQGNQGQGNQGQGQGNQGNQGNGQSSQGQGNQGQGNQGLGQGNQGNQGLGQGNQGNGQSSQGQGNQGQGNQGLGQGNQGDQGLGQGNQGNGQGSQGQGGSTDDQDASETGDSVVDDSSDQEDQTTTADDEVTSKGNGNGNGNGNGPPEDSPSITAPGRANRP